MASSRSKSRRKPLGHSGACVQSRKLRDERMAREEKARAQFTQKAMKHYPGSEPL